MKIYQLVIAVFLLSAWPESKVKAQQLDFELRYNDAAAQYEVYATPDASNNKYFVGGGSQLSILLPQDLEDVALQINTVAGGLWTDNSRVFAPESDHIHDYHGIASNGAMVHFVAGEEMLMFTFELPGGACRSDVRLFENTTDRDSRAPGMNGADFRNFFANVFDPLTNNWSENANSLNQACAHAPSVVPNSLQTIENIPVTVCMPINDPNVGDLFEATLCANVSASDNSTSNISISGNEVCLEYIPAPGFLGTESVCFEVCDDSGLCNTSTVSVLVGPEPIYSSLTAVSDQCENTVDYTIFYPSEFEYIELERSADDQDYLSLNLVESSNQSAEMSFNYVDEKVESNFYYRLKMVFMDGRVKYADPVFVEVICEEELINSQPAIIAVSNGCENRIDWTIRNPVAGSAYELQRSKNSTDFTLLEKKENTTESSDLAFHFTDKDAKSDHSYRVKISYADGRETYSETVFVESACTVEDGFLLYPNPVSQSDPILNIKFIAETKVVKIMVTDVLGRVVRRTSLEVELGVNTHRFDVADLPIGTYFVAMEGKEDIVKSFVKMDTR